MTCESHIGQAKSKFVVYSSSIVHREIPRHVTGFWIEMLIQVLMGISFTWRLQINPHYILKILPDQSW